MAGREPGTLYLCATPIGNLKDVTLRALEVLKEVDVVAAESVQRTRRLFARHHIETPLVSYREENRESAGRKILSLLEEGRDVALVSDSGTPGISDPGHHLVELCLESGFRVEPVPGPSAAIAALVVSGLPTRRFVFEGFLPRKRGPRRRALENLASETRTLVFYEGPSRVEETLRDMEEVLGDRTMALARELTKKHEEVMRGTVSEVRGGIEGGRIRGEIVLVVEGGPGAEKPSIDGALEEVRVLREQGASLKEAVDRVAIPGSGISRNELYNRALNRRKKTL